MTSTYANLRIDAGCEPLSLASLTDTIPAMHDPALFEPATHARLRQSLAALPEDLTHLFYLELRLDDDPAIDAIVHMNEEGRQFVLRGRTPEYMRTSGGPWSHIRSLCREWESRQSPVGRAIHHLWLEFDLGSPTGEPLTVPGVFVCFSEQPKPGQTHDTLCQDARNALRFVNAESGAMVDRCVGALPAHAHVPYIGVMFGRASGRARICVCNFTTPAEVSDYLDRLGWTGDRRAFRELVSTLSAELRIGQPGILHLDFDGDDIGRVGFEFNLRRAPQVRGGLDEGGLFAALHAHGLCTAPKADAVRHWPGTLMGRLVGEHTPRVITRRINHVKLVMRPNDAPMAKAYFAITTFYRTHPRFEDVPRSDLITRGDSCS